MSQIIFLKIIFFKNHNVFLKTRKLYSSDALGSSTIKITVTLMSGKVLGWFWKIGHPIP